MTTTLTFGDVLRQWRNHRRCSQLDLAIEAGVSQRHLSFLETGRSKPSREMVVHLAFSLGLGLRDQNELLVAAGFAPIYRESPLDSPSLDDVRNVLTQLLDAHGSFPAYIIDRGWNLVLANEAALKIIAVLDLNDIMAEVGPNVMRVLLHPDGARHALSNWHQVADATLRRLGREVVERPGDPVLNKLWAEVRAYDGVPDVRDTPVLPTGDELLVPFILPMPSGTEARFFTTIATIGAPFDITLEELRIETLLPADPAAVEALDQL